MYGEIYQTIDASYHDRYLYIAVHDAKRLTSDTQEIRVVAGSAWVTIGEQDYILDAGERLTLATDATPTVISQFGATPTLCEID